MTKIYDKNYLYLLSGFLNEDQITKGIEETVKLYDKNLKFKIRMTVVENKNYQKLGFSYAWVDNHIVYNILNGLNPDGSKRIEYKDDPDWEPPQEKISEEKSIKDISWGDLSDSDIDVEPRQIEIPLDTLAPYPYIKYTKDQKEEENISTEGCLLEIMPTMIMSDYTKKNSIYSNNISKNIELKDLYNTFRIFNNDTFNYFDKKKKKKYKYPIIEIKNRGTKNDCIITFSPVYKNTASFVLTIYKKLEIVKDNQNYLLFFSQSKK